jgi:hypothetical protein
MKAVLSSCRERIHRRAPEDTLTHQKIREELIGSSKIMKITSLVSAMVLGLFLIITFTVRAEGEVAKGDQDKNFIISAQNQSDSCVPWMQKYDKDLNPTGIWWRLCVPPDGRTYCEECKASPPGCDLNQNGCNPTSCSGHIKCN